MTRRYSFARNATLLVALELACLGGKSARRHRAITLPQTILWTWERPEDVRSLAGPSIGVAYLDRTVELTKTGAQTRLQRHALILPVNVATAAVVRVEAARGARLDGAAEGAVITAAVRASKQRGIRELQIDFDATRSQRLFYGKVLERVREQMPSDMPLSITALVSWCSYDDWIAQLPVDEAVPMYFRMGPDGHRTQAGALTIREPLCARSLGISTREARGLDFAAKRVYIFPDHGWRNDADLLAEVAAR